MTGNTRLYKGISIDKVRNALGYDPSNGILIWKISPSNRVKIGTRAGKLGAFGYRIIGV
ncbi:MAG: hypothetical protein JSC189_000044 [Candidatus Tokpelaia sp. JSC189]|nr:MAG: hypothetical protein JSC189_000044 [Candidatus Tokpelaia sp. JSC189]